LETYPTSELSDYTDFAGIRPHGFIAVFGKEVPIVPSGIQRFIRKTGPGRKTEGNRSPFE
jgi:hypothetical protein